MNQDNPYQSPRKDRCGPSDDVIRGPDSASDCSWWRRYIWAHFLVVALFGVLMLAASGRIHFPRNDLFSIVLGLFAVLEQFASAAFFIVGPFVDAYLIKQALVSPAGYGRRALVDVFLTISHFVFVLPAIQ